LSLLFLSSFVVSPACLRRLNVLVLAFLRPAADQNYNSFAVPAEVNTVAGAEVDLAYTPAPTLLVFDKFPCSMRVSAMVTLAAAVASSDSSQIAKRFVSLFGEAFVSLFGNVASQLDHSRTMVTKMLPLVQM